MEDEVDWSDSPIDLPPTYELDHNEVQIGSEALKPMSQEDYAFASLDQEHMDLAIGEQFTPHSKGQARLKPAISRVQRSRLGIHLNRRKPTREDYSNFVLYQGSQKVYEATFLKNFVAHALDPKQLEACLADSHEARQDIRQYLKSVSDNVNKLATKMIWNTHSRTVRFMANDGKETTPFWDFEQFNNQSFADFVPGGAFLVGGLMNQSWHRAFNHPSMVRYSAHQYQTGVDASPFEEIDDVTGHTTLFQERSVAHAASQRRVVRPSRIKKLKNCHLPGALPREDTTVHRQEWLQGFGDCGVAVNPVAKTNNASDALLPDTIARSDSGGERAFNAPTNNHNATIDGPPSSPENTPSDVTGMKYLWRMALIEDHKQRLAERWPQSEQPRESPLDLDGYINRAIEEGDLKRPIPGLRSIANFVDSTAVAPTPTRTQACFMNTHQAHIPERVSDFSHTPQTKIAMHQQGEIRGTAVKSTRADQPCNQASINRAYKQRKVAPKVKRWKAMENVELNSKQKASLTPSANSRSMFTHSGPSASKTLEDHQKLPPDAYFEKMADDEQPAWRCGIKHPMGHYYNAGDRKNCPGCFTAFRENPKRKVMDFYLPSRSHFFQPAPDITWKPGRPQGRPRRSKHMSHNSIAKDAYWDAISAGATADEALKKGIEAVEAYLQAKEMKREKKEPTPELIPEPVDLGPHPSGSRTMEHGQELPIGAYWKKQFRYDEFAWRCDINHTLGRYYLAGDVRSCPGCGSCRSGPGQHPQMDFYLPAGTIARQEAPDLVRWKPRPPYKLSKKSKKAKQVVTHNQFCSKKYWELIEEGREHVKGGANEEALALAIQATEAHIDAKLAAAQAKLEELESVEEQCPVNKGKGKQKEKSKQEESRSKSNSGVRHGRSGARLFSLASTPPLVPRKRAREELDDSELEEATEYEAEQGDEDLQEVVSISSSDEFTSDSDSE